MFVSAGVPLQGGEEERAGTKGRGNHVQRSEHRPTEMPIWAAMEREREGERERERDREREREREIERERERKKEREREIQRESRMPCSPFLSKVSAV